MKLSEIVAKLTGLENRLSAADKAEVSALKAQIDGQVAQLTNDLTTAQASIKSLGDEKAALETKVGELSAAVAGLDTNLNDAITALKLTPKADATSAEKISLLQSAVTDSLAKLGVPAGSLPNPAPNAGLAGGSKSLTMDAFNKLSPHEKMAFFKSGGKLTE